MRLALIGLLAATCLLGCRYVPNRPEAGTLRPSFYVESPSAADYPLATEVEHLRRARAVAAQLAGIRRKIADLSARRRALMDRLAAVARDTTSLPVVRAANHEFVLARIDEVESHINRLVGLGAEMQGGEGYEVNRAAQAERDAEITLKGGLPSSS